MRSVKAATKGLLRTASALDREGLCAYADVLHGVLKRMANDESMFFDYSDDMPEDNWKTDDDWLPEEYGDYSQRNQVQTMPTMEELERTDFQRELFELIMQRAHSPEGLTQEDRERQLQLMHYLKGNSWDSYTGDPENEKLRNILEDHGDGYMSEQIDDIENGY